MKHIELFKDGFDLTIDEKIKPENYPYVGHDMVSGEIVYTLVPEPVIGPADNEIWYTSTDGEIITPELSGTGYNIISNTYENSNGIIVLDRPVPTKFPGYMTWFGGEDGIDSIPNVTRRLRSIILPNSVTSIGTQAFGNCDSLSSITIPDSVTSIGDKAFGCCYSLFSITIPDSVMSIGEGAFISCSLTSITIPNKVTTIGRLAFNACTNLTSVVIGNSVTSIGEYAFSECTTLTAITFEGTVEQWNSITKGEDWKSNVPATDVQCTNGQAPL